MKHQFTITLSKKLLLSFSLIWLSVTVIAQPSFVGTALENGSYNQIALTDQGAFRQAQLAALSSGSGREWNFIQSSGDFSINWRPYTSGQILSGYNTVIDPGTEAASARYNSGSGGQPGALPFVQAGNYYTINITEFAPPANQFMSVLESNWCPGCRPITSVSGTGCISGCGYEVTVTLTFALAANEYVYVRYSTDGFATSSLVEVNFSGTTSGTATIPTQGAGVGADYYVYSSNRTLAEIQNQVSTYGELAHDMMTINLNNNGGSNYSVNACTNTIAFVDVDATGANNGTSWTDAFTHMQDALSSSCSGITEIWVAAGTYYPDEGNGYTDNDRTHSFVMKNNLAIYGGFAGTEDPLTFDLADRDFVTNETILSGDIDQSGGLSGNSYHVVHNDNNGINHSAILDGFTITAGNANGSIPLNLGGGMNNTLASPLVWNCRFTENSATYGGAMYNEGASPSILSCSFSENSASWGGGLYHMDSYPIITACSFAGNSGLNFGGGIYSDNSTTSVTNCGFTGNTANIGGGAYCTNSHDTFTNCSFSGNSTALNGGGIYIYNQSNVTVQNSIVWNNKEINGTGTAEASIVNNGGTVSIAYSLVEGQNPSGAGNLDGTDAANDPLFIIPVDPDNAPTTAGDFHVQACSPVIDAGNNDSIPGFPSNDLGGNPRIFNNGTVDMGAYEYQGTGTTLTNGFVYVNANVTGGNSDGSSWSDAFTDLQDAIDLAGSCSLASEIWVAEGTYYPTKDHQGNANPVDPRDKIFFIDRDMIILGGFPNTGNPVMADRNGFTHPTILDGDLGADNDKSNNSYTIFYPYNCTSACLLDGFIIQNAEGVNGGTLLQIDGGGMYLDGSSPTVRNCQFINNFSSAGGAIYALNSQANFVNCLFSENAADIGAAMYNRSSNTNFSNCTFSNNLSFNLTGIFAAFTPSPTFSNCIIWDNDGGLTQQQGASSIINYSIIEGGYSGTGNLNEDPLFMDAANGDLHLQSCSPAIDAGNNASVPAGTTTDLEGNPRFYNNGTVDMGAYEYQGDFAPCCPDGEVIFVDANASGMGDGTSWDDAFNYLQDALALGTTCANITQIWVAAGTYYPDEGDGYTDNDRNATFSLIEGIEIYGGFSGTETLLSQRDWRTNITILSGDIDENDTNTDGNNIAESYADIVGNNSYHVLLADGTGATNITAATVVDGFYITAGKSDGAEPSDRGAGLHCFGNGAGNESSPTIRNSSFFGNSANNQGGAIRMSAHYDGVSSPVVENCNFSGNYAGRGGAISGYSYGNNSVSAALFTNCDFYQNVSGSSGGAVALYAHDGGTNGTAFINCSFFGNQAGSYGGAIYNVNSSSIFTESLTNCILWGNTAYSNPEIVSLYASPIISHCIISGSGGSGSGWDTELGTDGGNNIDVDPQFVDTANGDLHLQACSPAINAGDGTSGSSVNTTTEDPDGNPRFYDGGIIDMGAYEYQGDFVPCCPADNTLTVNDPGDEPDANPGDGVCATAGGVCTFRAAIMEANELTACSPLTIDFSISGNIELTTSLPEINHPNLIIDGPGADQLTVERSTADGTPDFRIFTIPGGKTVEISGLTITNGKMPADAGGAGIRNYGTLSLDNMIITGNHADQSGGGGIYNQG